jgi:hypothetical protein
MRQFRVRLHGRLPPPPAGGEVRPRGFYVNRVVRASDAHEAGAAAIQLVRAEPKFRRLVESYGGEAPELVVEDAIAAPHPDPGRANRTGYVFYDDG